MNEQSASGIATGDGAAPVAPSAGHEQGHHNGKRLGAFLCWAIVFADIGTSVYYVPGILYSQVGRLAGLFVTMTLLVFLLLTLKYAEATHRFPEGGGEVTVATRGLSPWAGALGGMFILIDYFLTAAISSLSGLHYFSVLMPALTPYVLLVTMLVIAGLGVLNWWGIQESASVSAVIASLAFVSDIVIILTVLIRVPPTEIALVFKEIFSGSHLTGVTMLTGFAGAFLAFSGLESIAQLAPVMRLPRRKTVAAALGVVSLTVGFTSPLLTIFSTVLLTDPRFRGTMASASYATHPEPSQFISLLAGAYGGTILAVATAITASALLIFASNTAIIGGYHVVLALARLRYFPRVVTRMSARRGTPYIAIALVTLIPIAVLIAVRGNIDLLGELYGFGLLGAFSLMCISMDVIRWRERRGEPYIGARIDPELARGNGTAERANGERSVGGGAALERRVRVPPGMVALLAGREERLRAAAARLAGRWSGAWPHLKYALGFLTTALVLVAWLTNLFGKPLATAFGGGLTALGMAVAALHYRYQAARYPVVFLDTPRPLVGAWLVVLTADREKSKAVIKDALSDFEAHPPIFLYLAAPSHLPPPRLFEIRDRFALDEDAQLMLSRAKRACMAVGIPGRYLYAAGGAQQLFDISARVRPDEVMAEAGIAKRLARGGHKGSGMAISPDYVRFREVNGVPVAHYVLHNLYSVGH